MKKIIETLRKKWAEYLLEVIVIVGSILGAFFLDSWREENLKKKDERELLIQLKSEFENNVEQLDKKIEMREQIIESSRLLLHWISKPDPISRDSLYFLMEKTFYSPTFDPIINEVINSDRINLISNSDLKRHLSIWSSELIQVTEEEITWSDFLKNKYSPFFIEHLSLRDMVHFSENSSVRDLVFISSKKLDYSIPPSTFKENTAEIILKNIDFEDYWSQAIHLSIITNDQALALKDRMTKILQEINNSLYK